MAEEKRPAHLVIVEKIIKEFDAREKIKCRPKADSVAESTDALFDITLSVRIRAFLDVLGEMIIPDEGLKKLIDSVGIPGVGSPECLKKMVDALREYKQNLVTI